MRKNIDTTGAMTLTDPSETVTRAIPIVSSVARRGLLPLPSPFANGPMRGYTRSDAIDWRILGAPRNDAMADDRVAEITPSHTSAPTKARLRIADPSSSTRSAMGTPPAMRITTVTYTTVESPTAANVPTGRLRFGFSRSPDMLTPWVNPVTAGKKIANAAQ